MSDDMQKNKRIAKNTIMLYIRMMFSMVVSLYTSRVILHTLGVLDFGINNVVGGCVGLFVFLNDSMAGATSRFLTFELGRGDNNKLKETFSSAVLIHIFIAIIVGLLCETVGYWLLLNKLVVPVDRLFAAKCVFHFSVISMMVGIMQVPYNASIISHERMDVYAYVEIFNVCLKLLIVYLLLIGPFDKLILYSFLFFLSSLIIAMIYRIYSIRHFEECHFHFLWNREIIKSLFSFSGWDLYGNMSVMARTQGVSILLNVFFGPMMNAAAGVAVQVQNAVMAFSTNISMAIRPQVIKNYASGDIDGMITLMRNGMRFTFILMAFLSVPLMCELHFVLHLWLGLVPVHTVALGILTLMFNVIVGMNVVLAFGVHATGKIKNTSLINGTVYLLVLPLSYLAFKLSAPYWFPYLYNVIGLCVTIFSFGYTIQKYVPVFSVKKMLLIDFLKNILMFSICFLLTYGIHFFIKEEGWTRFFLSGIVSSALVLLSGYYFILPSFEREKVISILRTKICKKG